MLAGRYTGSLEAVAEALAGWDSAAPDERTARTRIADSLVACASTVETGNPTLSGLVPASDPDAWCRVLAARIRSSEIDDIVLRSCTTPGSVAVPAALGAAVAAGDVPAGRLVAAVAAGYAVVDWCGRLIGGAAAIDRGEWPTRAAASIGAAATAAVALDLDEATCRHALALAAASVWEGKPAEPARQLIFGVAVGYGLLAARMAADGVRGDLAAASRWSAAGTPGGPDGDPVGSAPTDFDPDSLRLARVKPFCCAQQAMSAVTGLMDIVAEHDLAAEDVRGIDVWVPPACVALIDRPVVKSRLDSIASLQYQLAVALYDPTRLWDVERGELPVLERAGAVAAITRVHADPELPERYPDGWAARVVVATERGDHIRLVRDDDPPEPETTLSAKIDRLSRPASTERARLESVVAVCSDFASGAALLDGLSRRVFASSQRKDHHAR